MDLSIATRLGAYEITALIGRGGMGEVYAASDSRLRRSVALKVLPPALADDPSRLARFEREAQAIAALNHPNIVTIYSVEQVGETHFLTMELVDGQTLGALIGTGGLPFERFLALAIDLTDAVSSAHDRGIVHRDLKPSNIMVTREGRLKVLDFGLAKLRPAEHALAGATTMTEQAHTADGAIVGTAAYMSPEQAQGEPVDHRADIFALGVIFYEMLAGKRPFRGENAASQISSILRDAPPSLEGLRPELPAAIERIVHTCLEKDPARRYQSGAELRSELGALRHEQQFESLGALRRHRDRRASGRRAVAAASAVAILAIGGGIAYWLGPLPGSGSGSGAVDVKFTQLTADPGAERFPALSPDGKWLAYVSDAAGNPDIYLQAVGGARPINLTKDSPDADFQPAFSPDGERIAFRSARDGGGLFVMRRTGEDVRRLTKDGLGFNPAWSPDSREVVFSTRNIATATQAPVVKGELSIVNVATQEIRRLETPADAVQPSWSPDGRRIAYWGIPAGGGRTISTTLASGKGETVEVVSNRTVDWNPVWSRDGQFLYFASDRDGSMNLWRIRLDERSGRPGGEPQRIAAPSSQVGQLSHAAAADRLVFSSAVMSNNIHSAPFDAATGTLTGGDRALTRGTRRWELPAPSPDGKWVAYNATGDFSGVWVSRPDGSAARQITPDGARGLIATWSADSRRLAFQGALDGTAGIFRIDLDGSGLERLTGGLHPVWSPDDRYIAMHGRLLDLSKPAGPDNPMQFPPLTTGGQDFDPWSWSPDGREIAGNSLEAMGAGGRHAGIVVYSLDTRTYRRLTDTGTGPSWSGDGRWIAYSAARAIHILDVPTRQTRELLRTESGAVGTPRFGSDGRLYYVRHTNEGDIWLATFPPAASPARPPAAPLAVGIAVIALAALALWLVLEMRARRRTSAGQA
jgi:eukaryotic-like serine/threonine-protein kinase